MMRTLSGVRVFVGTKHETDEFHQLPTGTINIDIEVGGRLQFYYGGIQNVPFLDTKICIIK
jgi:hypothetical protein